MDTAKLTDHLDDQITIRRAESVSDYRACQDAQRRAWGIQEEGYVVPIATMVGANLHGGLVLGAFHAGGHAVAMSFGFLGKVEDRLCLYSQLTGVVPEYQSRGLGYKLKMAQADFAHENGLTLIAWAFDPLQAGNARFNLDKLGARVRRYVDNMYGERTDALNAGVPTDRVIAEWEVSAETKPSTKTCTETATRLPRLIRFEQGAIGTPQPSTIVSVPDAPQVLLELPAQISTLRRDHPEIAESWRLAVKQAFQSAISAGYEAIGFVREDASGKPRCHYLLERRQAGQGL
jgi:predicted GNAT superfamily acetyltransferase